MSSFLVWFDNRSASESGHEYRTDVDTTAVEPSRIDPQKSASASEPSFWMRKFVEANIAVDDSFRMNISYSFSSLDWPPINAYSFGE
jgi:hypothetical protein